jgi:hypothetical protein
VSVAIDTIVIRKPRRPYACLAEEEEETLAVGGPARKPRPEPRLPEEPVPPPRPREDEPPSAKKPPKHPRLDEPMEPPEPGPDDAEPPIDELRR